MLRSLKAVCQYCIQEVLVLACKFGIGTKSSALEIKQWVKFHSDIETAVADNTKTMLIIIMAEYILQKHYISSFVI